MRRPLVILEALRLDYPWASDRHHAFALDGMAEHSRRTRDRGVLFYPYVEPTRGAGAGLLAALAARACAVVADWSPVFFLPRMIRAAAAKTQVRFEAVDSCGLLPLSVPDSTFSSAHHFRRFLQKRLPEHFGERPAADPLARTVIPTLDALPEGIEARWPRATWALLDGGSSTLADLPLDHQVRPVDRRGGRLPAIAALDAFLSTGLHRFGNERNVPDADVSSGLSPYLHWGHISAHEVFHRIAEREDWTPLRISGRGDGRRAGWWGMDENAEAFLDQFVTWRELGHVFCGRVPEYDTYATLPRWAMDTLEEHADDPREALYTREQFDRAETHDALWNAAQRQLRSEGVIHGYLRMLWGKKILEWTEHPREALAIMIDLNNRYSVDGRDPNSYSGIFWVLGRFDRGWPERPVYGKVRSMSSRRTRRKVNLEGYLSRFGG
jgi:deoxyribodipyrimidine photo-lyase